MSFENIIVIILIISILGIFLPINKSEYNIKEVLGEMWNYSNPAYEFMVGEAGIYYNSSFLMCGDLKNIDCIEETQENGGTYFIIKENGFYKIDSHISGKSTVAGGQYGIGVGINFNIDDRHCYGRVDGTNNANIVTISCVDYLKKGDKINMLFEEEDEPIKGFNIYSANLNIIKVGGVAR